MKIKMIDLWMQIEVRKLIFIMNFSVLDFFKFATRMPQTAQILVSTFKIFDWSYRQHQAHAYFRHLPSCFVVLGLGLGSYRQHQAHAYFHHPPSCFVVLGLG